MILVGDCIASMRTLPERSVQTCVTSPPYFGLRDYGHDGQIGLESTPDAFVAKLVEVFREVRRVLADDGTLWLNLGDSYASTGGKQVEQTVRASDDYVNSGQRGVDGVGSVRRPPNGFKNKDLIGIPWRVAFALQADGWYLRQDIIWHKPNPMPESVRDRCTKAHEYIFLLSKSERYYFDADAIRQPAAESTRGKTWDERKAMGFRGDTKHPTKDAIEAGLHIPSFAPNPNGVNRRSVWTVTTKPYKGAHFATFPPDLIEPCILAGSRVGDVVLDPFGGAGTTGLVSQRSGRKFVLCELNPEYARMAEDRIAAERDLLSEAV